MPDTSMPICQQCGELLFEDATLCDECNDDLMDYLMMSEDRYEEYTSEDLS